MHHVTRSLAALGALAAMVLALTPAAVAQEPPSASSVPGVGADVQVEVLAEETQDPTAIDVAPDGRVVWAERTGRVKVLPPDGDVITAGRLDVAANACGDCDDDFEEGGLHGLLLDRDFAATGRVYLYYSVPGSVGTAPTPPKHPEAGGPSSGEGLFRLSAFVLAEDNTLDLASEQVILENPAEWAECCHYGGDLDWAPDGTLLLSVGDDTNPHESSGYAPLDGRDGRAAFDAERTAANPADRRGKILRLNRDGSVPGVPGPDGEESDLAPNPHVDDPAFDPYVYAMGFRSNYSLAVDADTGATVVGNVGPDAYFDDEERGPRGHDEFEVVPPGGGSDHGWPYCIADNEPYHDHDFETGAAGEAFSCDGRVPAAIYYPYEPSADFPQTALGLRTALAGVVYPEDASGDLALPDRYRGQALLFEWARDVMWTAAMTDDGDLDADSLLTAVANLRHPIDAVTGPDGAVYLAEYGEFFYENNTSRISRIVCTGCGVGPGGDAAPDQQRSIVADTTGVPTSAATIMLAVAALAAVGLRRRRATV